MTIFATIIRVSLFKAWTFFNKSKGRTRNDRDTVLPPYCHHAHVKGGGLELLKTAAKRRNFIGLTKQRFFLPFGEAMIKTYLSPSIVSTGKCIDILKYFLYSDSASSVKLRSSAIFLVKYNPIPVALFLLSEESPVNPF